MVFTHEIVKLIQFVAFQRAQREQQLRVVHSVVHKSEISFMTYKTIYYLRYL